jgi:flagellar M-ring protein FliF
MPAFFIQFMNWIGQFTIGQRIALFTVLIGVVSSIIAIILWANRPEFTLLYNDLAPQDANEIVAILQEDGTPYQLGSDGTTIYVPAGNVTDYRLSIAASGIATGQVIGYELFDDQNMGMTTFMQRVNYQRALEGELTNTLNQMDEVQSSRVHLVMPERRLFEDEEGASASIILHLESRSFLRPDQIKGISALVANSVPDLRMENVSIVDAAGNLLTEAIVEGQSPMGGRNWEIRSSVEADLQKKAQDLVDNVLGANSSKIKVSATLNFEQLERTTEFYNTDEAAVLSEERNIERFTGADTSNRSVEQSVTNYELDKTIERYVASSGTIQRLTVAVLVDGRHEISTGAEGQPISTYVPRTQAELDQLGALVSSALGLNFDRGDQIEVQNMQFDREMEFAEVATVAAASRKDFWTKMITNLVVGLTLLAALFFLIRILRVTSEHINITQLLPAMASEEGMLVGGTEGFAAIEGGPEVELPPGAVQAEGSMEMVTDSFLQKLSPEARAKLEAHDKMTTEVTQFAEENPKEAAQLLRIWTTKS